MSDITPEMADYFLSAYANGCAATWAALRAHAAKANKDVTGRTKVTVTALRYELL